MLQGTAGRPDAEVGADVTVPQVPRQPWLHELNITVLGSCTALSTTSGDITPSGANGLFVDDRRVISELSILLGGEPPIRIFDTALASRAEFLGSGRNLGTASPDPVVEVHRHRQLDDMVMTERIEVTSRAAESISTRLQVRVASDGATIIEVKAGRTVPPLIPRHSDSRVCFDTEWHHCAVTFNRPPASVDLDAGGASAVFDIVLDEQVPVTVVITVVVTRARRSAFDAGSGSGSRSSSIGWADVRVTGADPRLGRAVAGSMADLSALRLTDPEAPADVFAGAGTPWYLTLFGRDSLWAAQLTLPLGTDLARGTLRALARRQGTRYNAKSAEAPGKIPHEIRRFDLVADASTMVLPSTYYGTVDATALWVILLHDAHAWGLVDADVLDLLDPLEAAVRWLVEDATGPDGLLRYVDDTGTGLSNQGWKDSNDAIRFRDGQIATAPIALVEAQAYAAHALQCAAQLLTTFSRPGAPQALQRSQHLGDTIRERFWVTTETSPYLGLGLDGGNRLVDGLGSNMGHVLGMGVLTPSEVSATAAHLTSPALFDAYGIRTLGADNGGFNPIGYHTGSIWTHDTAIIAAGLAAEGRVTDAVTVANTLLSAAEAFDYRFPELYRGAGALGQPAPYPAACRPQAWSAASAAVLLSVALGLTPDAPNRTLTVRPARPAAFGAMRIEGLKFCGERLDLDVDAQGTATVLRAPDNVRINIR